MKKLNIILTGILFFTQMLFPVYAEAETTLQPDQASITITDNREDIADDFIEINDSLSAVDEDGLGILHALEKEDEVQAASNPVQIRDEIFTDEEWDAIEEAGALMRPSLKAREEKIVIPISLPVSMTVDTLKLAQKRVIQCALKETRTGDEGAYLDFQVFWVSGNISGSTSGNMRNLKFTFNMSYDTTLEQEQAVSDKIQEVLRDLDIESMTSDYEKAWEIYRYVAQNVTYDYDHLDDEAYRLQYTPYAALINGTAVCQGYTLLLYRMLWEAGVDNHVVEGIRKGGGNHIWNIILMNGWYYNCDSTWDSSTEKNNTFFLKSDDTFAIEHERRDAYAEPVFYEMYPMGEKDFVLPGSGLWSVRYQANGGEGAPSEQEKLEGEPLTLSAQIPVRAGYYFLGWNHDIEATEAEYQPGDVYTTDDDLVLYAIWKLNEKIVIEKKCSVMPGNKFTMDDFMRWIASDMLDYHLTVSRSGKGLRISSDAVTAVSAGTSKITIDAEESYAPVLVVTVTVLDPEEAVMLPADVLEIDESGFQNTDIQAVVIPDSCQKIGKLAFANNEVLSYIFIPDSVQSIADDTFADTPNATIFCHRGSEAFLYARRAGMKYVVLMDE